MNRPQFARRFTVIATMLCALTAFAGDGGDGDEAFSDAGFLKKAAVAGLAEVALGQVAQRQSGSPQVRQFADMMVQDHLAHGQKLRKVASGVGVKVPARLDGRFSPVIQKFAALQGPQLDAEYIAAMVSDHEQTVRQFQIASVQAQSFSVRSFAKASLPMLQAHLDHANAMMQQMRAAATGAQGGVLLHRYPVKGLSCPTYY